MKRLMTALLGLAFLTGTVVAQVPAPAEKKTEAPKKGKAKGKKTDADEKKAPAAEKKTPAAEKKAPKAKKGEKKGDDTK